MSVDSRKDDAVRGVLESMREIVKICVRCGLDYDAEAYQQLKLCTSSDAPDGRLHGLEHRNCACGTTLAVKIELLDD